MKALTKSLIAFVLLAGTATSASVATAQPALYVEGTHYEAIAEPVRTTDPNKIEVTEVFWYGCPHCYAFEPLLESWVEKLPSDVAFVRSPGMWNDLMKTHAQIYYTSVELGVLDKMHSITFDNFHQKNNYLQTPEEIRAMYVAEGVSAADFDKAWASFQVNSAVRQADSRMRAYGVRGVPNLIINGKYLITTGESVPTQADMLKIADFLIGKERGS
jgi:thiol:disulfide interchange protein DsbA